MLKRLAKLLVFAVFVQAFAYATGAVLPACATSNSSGVNLKDCNDAGVQASIANVLPTIEIVLSAAVEGWQLALEKLAIMWGGDGLAYMTCAIREVREHALEQVTAATPGPGGPVEPKLRAAMMVHADRASLAVHRADVWLATHAPPPRPPAPVSGGGGK